MLKKTEKLALSATDLKFGIMVVDASENSSPINTPSSPLWRKMTLILATSSIFEFE